MIPADIDNFIVYMISQNYIDGSILINNFSIKYIPKEISNCTKLARIYICTGKIVDITALSNCISLKVIFIENNRIRDISALSKCIMLKKLYLTNNKIIDVSALSKLPKLTKVDLMFNKIKNKSSVAHLNLDECFRSPAIYE